MACIQPQPEKTCPQGLYYIEQNGRKKRPYEAMVKKIFAEMKPIWGGLAHENERGRKTLPLPKNEAPRLLDLYLKVMDGGSLIDGYIIGAQDIRSNIKDLQSSSKRRREHPGPSEMLLNVGILSTNPEVDQNTVRNYYWKHDLETIEEMKNDPKTLCRYTCRKSKYHKESLPERIFAEEKQKKIKGRKSEKSGQVVIPKVPTNVEAHLHQGTILSESGWWILPNDWFSLATIHSGKPLYLGASLTDEELKTKGPRKKPRSKDLWDSKNGRPTAFGREVYLAIANGYTKCHSGFRKHQAIVLTLPHHLKKTARNLSFLGLREQIAAIPTTEDGYFDYIREAFLNPSERADPYADTDDDDSPLKKPSIESSTSETTAPELQPVTSESSISDLGSLSISESHSDSGSHSEENKSPDLLESPSSDVADCSEEHE